MQAEGGRSQRERKGLAIKRHAPQLIDQLVLPLPTVPEELHLSELLT